MTSHVAQAAREELQSSPAELVSAATGLSETIRQLAALPVEPARRGRPQLHARLRGPLRAIEASYRRLAQTAPDASAISGAAEWLLDNHHIVQRAIRMLRDEFPPDFERRLPRLTAGPLHGYPLAYGLARAIVLETESHVDLESVTTLVREFQTVRPLAIAEVWALPALLRLAILEQLAAAATRVGSVGETAQEADTGLVAGEGAAPVHDVGNCIRGLRVLETSDWKVFFEHVSHLEQTLREDPAGVYARMDFDTRDTYRKKVEELSVHSQLSEEAVADTALQLAASVASGRGRHVGYYLIDDGVPELERRVGYRAPWRARRRRLLLARPAVPYLGSILLLTLLGEFLLAAALLRSGAGAGVTSLAVVLGLVPVSTVCISFIHGVITRLLPPRVLPKMDFAKGIPADCPTMVAVPAMLTDAEEIDSLVRALEIRYLANADPRIHFALLTDFRDASEESLPGDALLVERAREQIIGLNEKYAADGERRFHLFHRQRVWNSGESRWMGWERKRGKLDTFNRVVRGDGAARFAVHVGDPAILSAIRFVITLDADTELPRGAAARLIETLAHPLNRAKFDAQTGALVRGYSVLQPRVEISPVSADISWFSRIFSGDTGLDPYTRAVSDVYQDLFGEGVYVGKGIYDVEAFQRSLRGRIPEASLLSHDLFEGVHGRAALVTDVALFEDYPSHYLAYTRRLHRWARGDWQLLPWLGRRVPLADGHLGTTQLSVIGRWKILDNLRRSLLAPTLIAFLVVAWLAFPGSLALWTLLAVLVPAAPGLTDLTGHMVSTAWASRLSFNLAGLVRTARVALGLWLLEIVVLAHHCAVLVDAIGRTLLRVYVTRRHLLEWTTAARTARRLARGGSRLSVWREMVAAPLIAAAIAVLLAGVRPAALIVAAPLLILWTLSPELAVLISRPRQRTAPVPLSAEQTRRLRALARRTWAFFETFAGPQDQWLVPDHFQEDPRGVVARRTSPTNIGLLHLATVSAYDCGYRGLLWVALRLKNVLDTMDRMERYRGHFLNWYDTTNLQPLMPRYVSTVDSGNLAGCLLLSKQSCLEFAAMPVIRAAQWDGFIDTLAVFDEVIAQAGVAWSADVTLQVRQRLEQLGAQVEVWRNQPAAWRSAAAELVNRIVPELDRELVALVEANSGRDPGLLAEFRLWWGMVRRHVEGMEREMDLLAPWLRAFPAAPALFRNAEMTGAMAAAWTSLQAVPLWPALADVPATCAAMRAKLTHLGELLNQQAHQSATALAEERLWVHGLREAVGVTEQTATYLLDLLAEICQRIDAVIAETDFELIYDDDRRLFFIGYDVSHSKLDDNHYDLLASEARLASFLAIAKGDVPEEHWLHLGRPIGKVAGTRALLSWNGTSFEYLMPRLLLREESFTLIGRSCDAAVREQIRYGATRGVPWGVSESGYCRVDAQQNYQYRAFGIPALGFRRGLEDDLVVTPYASLLAVGIAPGAVMENIERLAALGMWGRYGLYEAIDFTPARVPAPQKHAIVRSFMAHHQGMILAAVNNFLHADVLVKRFHAEPLVQTAELLLYERPAIDGPIEQTRPRRADQLLRRRPRLTTEPWRPTDNAPVPQAHVLSNGQYSLVVNDGGAVSSRWKGLALTRWVADATSDDGGFRTFLRDVDSGRYWTLFHSGPGDASNRSALFHPHMVELQARYEDVSVRESITVAPEADVEVRVLTLANDGRERRRLEIRSYAEVVLDAPAAARRHPVFSRLFVVSEHLGERHALLFHRRPGSPGEQPPYLLHMMVLPDTGATMSGYEAARDQFIGRGNTVHTPQALNGRAVAGKTGATLDPIMSLAAAIELPPHRTVHVAFVTVVGESREAALAIADRYRSLATLEWVHERARARCELELAELNVWPRQLPVFAKLLSFLLYPQHLLRAPVDVLAKNTLGRSALWKHAISGDLPILLVRVRDPENSAVLQELLRAQAFWRGRGVSFDLVVLNERATGYSAELHDRLFQVVANSRSEAWLHRPGGIFLIRMDQLTDDDRTLLLVAARVVLDGSSGSIDQQLERLPPQPPQLPPLAPTLPPSAAGSEVPRPADLLFDNGFGGFSADGREYVIHLPAGSRTPAPWVNVIANPGFGFVVSESGGGYTWAENSGENRLTPWRNDPVSDEPAEALYLRDEETAEVWSPTPLPAPAPGAYQTRHGAGYTTFVHHSHDLEQQLRLFVPANDPIKIIELQLTNRSSRPRRITATLYLEWVLGTLRETSQHAIISSFDPEAEILLAQNPWNDDFGDALAFVAASQKLHGFTADRSEFIGRHGTLAQPAALGRIGLTSTVRSGLDPCAALQLHLDLAPGETKAVHFLLGQTRDRERAVALVRSYREIETVQRAWEAVEASWDALLGARTVHTPDAALDVMINRWLLYQTLSARVWGRTGFYQSSGAFGFRDQLQDVLALLHVRPDICREHILECARHQFEDGDVLHWWHPPHGAGLRTRYSDDLLWLPFVVTEYVQATGDHDILSAVAPFLKGERLRPGESERYDRFIAHDRAGTLYQHCLRALERAQTAGAHGLPLFGSGDWNDGMNRVGIGGRGESVWLGWFLYATLTRFAPLCRSQGESQHAEDLLRHAEDLRTALDAHAWDGRWYRRGYYDDGKPLGSAERDECQIDSISQSWAVLSEAGWPARDREAMDAVRQRLVRQADGLILLLAPPFDRSAQDPGYIRAYPPGIRENGGQYTHAAIWVVWALAKIGEHDLAAHLFHRLLPIDHATNSEAASRYRVEPYVIVADVYGAAPHTGRGGWTWYTGSAAWAYRFGWEMLVGLRQEPAGWRLEPRIPADWPGLAMTLRDGDSVYEIEIEKDGAAGETVTSVTVDDEPQREHLIPRLRDGRRHHVRVMLGVKAPARAARR